ncbi:uncharacterized protein L969DRAFT_96643 [Mixia osmundae IAM 14324]|uniref:Thioesterase domain-containing protein n=1 Tax=Mixia osmundae (strain CBS 9802 / IAM 14324 / JCM 22182 / KY 12970) TaxID=764103 RepID=G7EB21_MIXOS|nr:uncharacterized protein L969DRAFT_96643 [Mixia osmundae IAM 14324]KEI37064.1 hypothetical protein L969DRAFT_96643 [Mixia osmundae IAM 14324]GAB00032.1 hypothetical protein E5Q_06734 [Mixia osmundae IAM 14324]
MIQEQRASSIKDIYPIIKTVLAMAHCGLPQRLLRLSLPGFSICKLLALSCLVRSAFQARVPWSWISSESRIPWNPSISPFVSVSPSLGHQSDLSPTMQRATGRLAHGLGAQCVACTRAPTITRSLGTLINKQDALSESSEASFAQFGQREPTRSRKFATMSTPDSVHAPKIDLMAMLSAARASAPSPSMLDLVEINPTATTVVSKQGLASLLESFRLNASLAGSIEERELMQTINKALSPLGSGHGDKYFAARETARQWALSQGYDEASLYEQRIIWGDVDSFRHVNNVVYFKFVESARVHFFETSTRGLSPHIGKDIIQGVNTGLILASTNGKFIRPCQFPDTLMVCHKVTHVARDRFTTRTGIYSLEQQKLVNIGDSTCVAYDYNALGKTDLPEEYRERLEEMLATSSSIAA